MIQGIGVSPGIAIAKATLLQKERNVCYATDAADIGKELATLNKAYQTVAEETDILYEKTLAEMGEEQAKVFVAHRLILEDPELLASLHTAIEQDGRTAPCAIETCMGTYIALFDAMEDEYMRERAADLRDIKERLIDAALGRKRANLAKLPYPTVIVAKELSPSDTAAMDIINVAGIVTQCGGRTSHAAIMARSLGIPAVSGLGEAVCGFQDGDLMIIDGETGTVYAHPDEAALRLFEAKSEKQRQQKETLKAYKNCETVTLDGRKVELAVNIGTPAELLAALENGAEGVGLFRSEFLFMDRAVLPTEDEQFQAYKRVLKEMQGGRVIVRTLDIGGDKPLPCLDMPHEENPFLGYRAIRICLDEPALFRTQLRALLRASAYGNLHIMFPMISSIQELRQAKAALEQAKAELYREGIAYAASIPVGIMIEIPAAAIMADVFAAEVDFFSIGTNDLIQYVIASDRGNPKVASLYTPYHPAILRLVAGTIKAAHDNGIFCGMCGEAAGDERLAPVWIGLGLDEFSVSTSSILNMRKSIAGLSYDACKRIASVVISLCSSEDVSNYLNGKLEL